MNENNKELTLSIVIPVYNEQRYIAACLDSIASQTVAPNEVLVVDNNCTDKTLKIAKKYKFVSVIRESRQHQSFAQATGFNKAQSDILGRIDADSVLPPGWVEKIKQAFTDGQPIAVTGGANPYDAPLKALGSAIFHAYIFVVGLIAGHRMLWGSNCAITKDGWRKVAKKVLLRPDIWEDYDLAFCLNPYGEIRYIAGNSVGVSLRSMHTTFSRHVSYQFRSVRTFFFRANPLQLVLFVLLWSLTFLVYPLAAFDDWLLKRREQKVS